MSVTSLKISSFKVANKPELAKMLVQFICILKKLKLSETEMLVLAHFMIEGYNEISKEQIIESKLLKNKATLANTLTVFRKNHILVKEHFRETLSPDFRLPITDKINLNITLDNT